MIVEFELWRMLSSSSPLNHSCSCITRWEDGVDKPDARTLRTVMVTLVLTGEIKDPGLWTLRLSTSDARCWLSHFRVVETDEGPDIADELLESQQTVNVTRWPPRS